MAAAVDEMQSLINLQSITEKLLFSVHIPQEIADKYNYLKETTFTTLGLEFIPAERILPSPPRTHAHSSSIGGTSALRPSSASDFTPAMNERIVQLHARALDKCATLVSDLPALLLQGCGNHGESPLYRQFSRSDLAEELRFLLTSTDIEPHYKT